MTEQEILDFVQNNNLKEIDSNSVMFNQPDPGDRLGSSAVYKFIGYRSYYPNDPTLLYGTKIVSEDLDSSGFGIFLFRVWSESIVSQRAVVGTVGDSHIQDEHLFADTDSVYWNSVSYSVLKSFLPLKKPETLDLSRFPHKCDKCGSPAYIGFSKVDCSNPMCT